MSYICLHKPTGGDYDGPGNAGVEADAMTTQFETAVDSLPRSKSDLSDFDHFGRRSPVDPTSRGAGLGRGVVPCGTEVQHLATPTPNPSPQGGGEQFAAPSHITLALIELDPAIHLPRKKLFANRKMMHGLVCRRRTEAGRAPDLHRRRHEPGWVYFSVPNNRHPARCD
jgi:hypothetical protein